MERMTHATQPIDGDESGGGGGGGKKWGREWKGGGAIGVDRPTSSLAPQFA